MRHIVKQLLFLILVTAQFAAASDEIVVGKGSSNLSIKPGTASECIVTSIERYKRYFLFRYDYEHNYYYLITQTVEVGEGCFEGNKPANVSLAAQKIDVRTGHVSNKTVWSFSTKGTSGEKAAHPLLNLYSIFYPGCCGASNTIKYFSLSSGKLIGASSLKPLILEIPNTTKVRYITVQDNNASDYMGKKAGAAAIFYSDGKNIKQELLITVPNTPKADCFLTRLNFAGKKDDERKHELWQHLTFNGISVIVELACAEVRDEVRVVVDIPIIEDKLSPQKATIKGLSNAKITDVTH